MFNSNLGRILHRFGDMASASQPDSRTRRCPKDPLYAKRRAGKKSVPMLSRTVQHVRICAVALNDILSGIAILGKSLIRQAV